MPAHKAVRSPAFPLMSVGASAALLLTACSDAEVDQAHGTEHVERGHISQEGIEITDAWIPEPANPEVGVLYLKAHNTSDEDDTIVDVTTSASEDAELCSTQTTESGAERMLTVDEIPVAAGASTELASGGYHIMINDIDTPLEPEDLITVTLTFGSGTEVEFKAPVEPMGAGTGEDHSHHDHGEHH